MFRTKYKKKIIIPTSKINYPYGLCIKTESGYFLIRENCRFRIPTKRVLESWRLDVIESSEKAVAHLKILSKVGFRDGTIIKNIVGSKTYLVSKNKKRLIISPDAFDKYGLDLNSIIMVSDEEANLHEDGEVLG
jgi:hypothetical protein